MRPPPFLKDCTAFLYEERNGEYLPIGSGVFLVMIEGRYTFSYIVTCKHVVKSLLDTNEPIYIRFNRSDQPTGVAYRKSIGEWFYHKDDAVDLAVLSIHVEPGHAEPLEAYLLDAGVLLNDERMARMRHSVGDGDEVFFAGLFRPYHGEERNYPMYRYGHVALLTDELIEGEYGPSQYFLAEILAFPFNSGSPLFTLHIAPDADPRRLPIVVLYSIVGIVAGFYPVSERLRNAEGDMMNITHLGISTVIPAQKVWEILNREELVKARKDKVGAGRRGDAPMPAGSGLYAPADSFTREDMQKALRKVSRRRGEAVTDKQGRASS